VQAARSGVQNIAEGSQASGTSKKTELKLTNVARASLEELRLDYEDFLAPAGAPPVAPADHPALPALQSEALRHGGGGVGLGGGRAGTVTDEQGRKRVRPRAFPHLTIAPPVRAGRPAELSLRMSTMKTAPKEA
jgi:hypothetical protein